MKDGYGPPPSGLSWRDFALIQYNGTDEKCWPGDDEGPSAELIVLCSKAFAAGPDGINFLRRMLTRRRWSDG